VTQHSFTGNRLEGQRARDSRPHYARQLRTLVFEREVHMSALCHGNLGYLPSEKKLRKARLEDIIEEAGDFGYGEIFLSR
jgi:hypothetical protein